MPEKTSERGSSRETRESAPLESVGIIGHGHFGGLTETLIKRFAPGTDVRIYAPGHKQDEKKFFPLESVARSDAVVLAVPINQYESVLKEIAPTLRPESTIVDIATVKEYTEDLIAKTNPGQRFISMHPMFGPESYKKKKEEVNGFKVVITGSNLPPRELGAFRSALESAGADVREMSAEEHDRKLADTLFVTHLFGQILAHAGFKRTDIDTPSFGWLMDAADSVRNDAKLFKDVFEHNRFCKDALHKIGLAEEQVHQLYLNGD